jgi:hypothetical protein
MGLSERESGNIPEQGPEQQGNQQSTAELAEEAKKIRRLQIMMNMVMSVLCQDPELTIEEASEMAANSRRAALTMFPDKELAWDLIYKPRLQRLLHERFRLM